MSQKGKRYYTRKTCNNILSESWTGDPLLLEKKCPKCKIYDLAISIDAQNVTKKSVLEFKKSIKND